MSLTKSIESLPIYIIGSHGCSPSRFGTNEESVDFPKSRYFIVPDNHFIIYFNNNTVQSEGSKNIPFIKNLYDYNRELFYYIINPKNYGINIDKTNKNSYRNPDFFQSLPFFSNFNYICNIEIYPPGVPCPQVHLSFTEPSGVGKGYFEGVVNIDNIIYDTFGNKLNFSDEIYSPYNELQKYKGFVNTDDLIKLINNKNETNHGIFFISACRAEFFIEKHTQKATMIDIHPINRNCGNIEYDLSIIQKYKSEYPDSSYQVDGVRKRTIRRYEIKNKIDNIITNIYEQNTNLYNDNLYQKLYDFIILENGKYNMVVNFNKIEIDCNLQNNDINERLKLLDIKFNSLRAKLINIDKRIKENINQSLYTSLGFLYRMCFYYLVKYKMLPDIDVYYRFIEIINSIDKSLDKNTIGVLINEIIKNEYNYEIIMKGGNNNKNKYLKYKSKKNKSKKNKSKKNKL